MDGVWRHLSFTSCRACVSSVCGRQAEVRTFEVAACAETFKTATEPLVFVVGPYPSV